MNKPDAVSHTDMPMRCFACNRVLKTGYQVSCADDQKPVVGSECWNKIAQAGDAGWQPPLGGPRLFQYKPE